jgi:hypothetical protein
MKGLLICVVIGVAGYAMGCDPELSTALADVDEAAPSVCEDFCGTLVGCNWAIKDEETGADVIVGGEKPNMMEDAKRACVVQCAYRAANGPYIFEHNHETGTYTVKEQLPGDTWLEYFECLWDKKLWICEPEHNQLTVQDTTEPQCLTLNSCYDLLGIHMKLYWHIDNGSCYTDGAEHFWDGWGGTFNYR